MPNKRLITGREGHQPLTDMTVETHGEGLPRPREAKLDQNRLHGEHKHGTNKGTKVPMEHKEK